MTGCQRSPTTAANPFADYLYAARLGNQERLKDLLIEHPSLISDRRLGETLLHEVAWIKRTVGIQPLLDHGADIEAQNKHGETPVYISVKLNDLPTMLVLLKAGADPNVPDEMGHTPLHHTSHRGFAALIPHLIANGADVNYQNVKQDSMTPLHSAAEWTQPEAVAALIAAGADVNRQTKIGYTALTLAIDRDNALKTPVESEQDIAVVKHLLAAGANPLIENNLHQSGLSLATKYQDKVPKIKDLILKHINRSNDKTN